MLTALCDDVRVYATAAEKGRVYICPSCRFELVLKKGLIKVHHFAHKPPTACEYGTGETLAHMEAKLALHTALLPRSHQAEMEWPIDGLEGDRRADVFVWDMRGARIAFELQHTSIGLDEIAQRSASYMARDIAVVWLPFLRQRFRGAAERGGGGAAGDWIIPRYEPRPFERWAHTFGFKEIWYWAVRSKQVMRGRFDPMKLKAKGDWAGAATERVSRKWCTLRLWGPYDPALLALRQTSRKPAEIGPYTLPGGPIVRLEAVVDRPMLHEATP